MRSLQGKGSVFSIEVPLTPQAATLRRPTIGRRAAEDASTQTAPRAGAILIIEDDPEVREHLELFLNEEGYRTSTAVDGPAALELLARGTTRPDLVLADYNLPNGMNGVQVSQKLRQELDRQIPFIILTGDISTETLRDIALHDCVHLNKPVKLQRSDAGDREAPGEAARPDGPPARIALEEPERLRAEPRSSSSMMTTWFARRYAPCSKTTAASSRPMQAARRFSRPFDPGKSACLLIDAYLPGMSGLELLAKLHEDGHRLPAIMITGNADVPHGGRGHEGGRARFHREADRPRRTHRKHRAGSRTVEGFGQIDGGGENRRRLTSRA